LWCDPQRSPFWGQLSVPPLSRRAFASPLADVNGPSRVPDRAIRVSLASASSSSSGPRHGDKASDLRLHLSLPQLLTNSQPNDFTTCTVISDAAWTCFVPQASSNPLTQKSRRMRALPSSLAKSGPRRRDLHDEQHAGCQSQPLPERGERTAVHRRQDARAHAADRPCGQGCSTARNTPAPGKSSMVPRSNGYSALLTRASVYLETLPAIKSAFIERGMPADFDLPAASPHRRVQSSRRPPDPRPLHAGREHRRDEGTPARSSPRRA
jgi:hypothetical protein